MSAAEFVKQQRESKKRVLFWNTENAATQTLSDVMKPNILMSSQKQAFVFQKRLIHFRKDTLFQAPRIFYRLCQTTTPVCPNAA